MKMENLTLHELKTMYFALKDVCDYQVKEHGRVNVVGYENYTALQDKIFKEIYKLEHKESK
jgi:hypothetical protein|tara:strand:+ start:722 stop:904 length:183 start_codon:yes stop_codon:yes gene_type:complete